MFTNFKLDLKRDRFESIEDIKKAITNKQNSIPVETFQKAIEDWKTRSLRCIEVREDYFE